MNHLIAPSILSANFGQLDVAVELINRSQADWIHVDVMDGIFVPNISFGFPVLKSIQRKATKPLDVHLMIVQPERYFEDFKKHGADTLTIHYEACTHLHRSIHAIKELGMKAGVSLNPHTPVSMLQNVIADIDLVLIMSVNPGYGGQSFIQNSYQKIKETKALILRKSSKALIEVDGGVSLENTPHLLAAGADVLVAGNTVFGSNDPEDTIQKLKSLSPAH